MPDSGTVVTEALGQKCHYQA